MESILMRPAQRIARVELEAIVPRDQIGMDDEIGRIAGMSFCSVQEVE